VVEQAASASAQPATIASLPGTAAVAGSRVLLSEQEEASGGPVAVIFVRALAMGTAASTGVILEARAEPVKDTVRISRPGSASASASAGVSGVRAPAKLVSAARIEKY
jgi:hypothetical protein